MDISYIVFLAPIAGIIGGLLGGRIYKKNKRNKNQ